MATPLRQGAAAAEPVSNHATGAIAAVVQPAATAESGDAWQHHAFVSTVRPRALGGDTQIWLVDPDNPGPYGDMSLLSAAEQLRARRFFRDVNRREYIAAHALLRTQLGMLLGEAPQAIAFTTGAHGRPELVETRGLSFSISHTTGLVGCAIACGAIVGLDLEPVRPIDALAMAPGILDAVERQDVAAHAGDGQWQRFLQYWTLKEAALKVRGTGLTLPADGAAIRWCPDGSPVVAALPDGAQAAWHATRLWSLEREPVASGPTEL